MHMTNHRLGHVLVAPAALASSPRKIQVLVVQEQFLVEQTDIVEILPA